MSSIGNYIIKKSLGEGSFAKVKLAVHIPTKQKVALKIIDKSQLDEYSLKNLYRESNILKQLDHQNIIHLYEIIDTKKELILVLEYAPGGELLNYIVAHGKLREIEAKRFMRQIVDALMYCHYAKSVIHRDLKAENLLLDDELNVKISDFGLSSLNQKLVTFCGSPVYSAPELIEGKKYGSEIDVWSLGVNLYAMVVGELPFADRNINKLYDSISKGDFNIPDYLSAECKNLIKNMLIVNPKKRISLKDVGRHVWMIRAEGGEEGIRVVDSLYPNTEADIDTGILDRLAEMGYDSRLVVNSLIGRKYDRYVGLYLLMRRASGGQISQSGSSSQSDSSSQKPNINDRGRRGSQGSHSDVKSGTTTTTTTTSVRTRPRANTTSTAVAPVIVAATAAVTKTTTTTATKPSLPSPPINPAISRIKETRPRSRTISSTIPSIESITSSNDSGNGITATTSTSNNNSNNSISSIDPSTGIRTVRFAFNLSTTFTQPPNILINAFKSTFETLNISYSIEGDYLFQCIPSSSEIQFEMELCNVPRLNIYGIRFRRRRGDIWEYKRVCTRIITELKYLKN